MLKVKYQIEYLPLFYKDLEEKLDYISNCLENKSAAKNLLNLVENKLLERLPMAESFEPYRDKKIRKYPYYRIYVQNYVIFYIVRPSGKPGIKTMEVRRFLYCRQNQDILI